MTDSRAIPEGTALTLPAEPARRYTMNIALIGPGAMGLLFGGYLSKHHDVTLIGSNPENMRYIEEHGVAILATDGTEETFRPHATADASHLGPADLVLLFVKSGITGKVLEQNRNLIGPDTILMTLQNGAGHENVLKKYTDEEHVLIGTTQQGSSRRTPVSIYHSGLGSTSIGAITGDSSRFARVAEAFSVCGFPCEVSDQVRGMIWNKLMINASSSVLSGVLQVPQGYVASNPAAWSIAENLITEICAVAAAEGYRFDAADQIARIRKHLEKAPDGLTSIYADLKAGRITEAPVINGAVVDAARRLGIPVPTHETILALVHAMEERA